MSPFEEGRNPCVLLTMMDINSYILKIVKSMWFFERGGNQGIILKKGGNQFVLFKRVEINVYI